MAAVGLAVFILATYGFGTVVGVLKAGLVLVRNPLDSLSRSPWFFYLKPLAAMAHCPPCLALWAGLALSICGLSPCRLVWTGAIRELAWTVDALAAAGATWLLHVLAERVSKDLDL